MSLVKIAIPNEIVEVYPYIGDRRGRFRLGDLVELTDFPASTCHKILQRMARYGIITKQSKRSRVWIKKFDTISEWIQNYLLIEVKELETKGISIVKRIEKEERPL